MDQLPLEIQDPIILVCIDSTFGTFCPHFDWLLCHQMWLFKWITSNRNDLLKLFFGQRSKNLWLPSKYLIHSFIHCMSQKCFDSDIIKDLRSNLNRTKVKILVHEMLFNHCQVADCIQSDVIATFSCSSFGIIIRIHEVGFSIEILQRRKKKQTTTMEIAVECVGRNTSFPKVENTINGFSRTPHVVIVSVSHQTCTYTSLFIRI